MKDEVLMVRVAYQVKVLVHMGVCHHNQEIGGCSDGLSMRLCQVLGTLPFDHRHRPPFGQDGERKRVEQVLCTLQTLTAINPTASAVTRWHFLHVSQFAKPSSLAGSSRNLLSRHLL
jgi:hypothetical protein